MKKIFLTILALFITFSTPATYALSEAELDKLDAINAPYYKPSSLVCNLPTGSFDGITTTGLSPLQAAFVDEYYPIVERLSIEYGIPWEAVMAQGILESASGTSNFARTRNNFFGIGAFDSNPDNAFSYSSPAEGWRGYYENIRKTATYRQHGAFNYPGDPYGYLRAIKAAGYATADHYVSSVSAVIAGVENRAAEKGWKSSAELLAENPSMAEAATRNQAGGGSTPTVSGDFNLASNCKPSDRDNGDINSTALTLSWPERGHDPWNDPKPEYRAALASTGVNRLGDSCSMNGNSCDAFVATVLRYSGADPGMVCCGVGNMMSYMLAHPELYQEIPNTGSTANLQPGDIRVNGGHIELYVVLPSGEGRIASASHCDRTADHAGHFYADSSYRIFRRKLNNVY